MTILSVKEEESPSPSSSLLKSVSDLKTLSTSLSAFNSRWNDLQNHLDSIQFAIATRSKSLEKNSKPKNAPIPGAEVEADAEEKQKDEADPRTEIERICDTMNSRALRKYLVSHLSNLETLRSDVLAALKRAPDPAKLVLDCVGRFYLQGSKAYDTYSPMVLGRKACILILELFLQFGCSKIDPPVKKEAKEAALSWRNRLVTEGGLAKATNADSIGLLLLVAAFGIPSEFGKDDLRDLIRLGGVRKKAEALRRSPFLIEKVEEIIQGMVNKGMFVAAIDFVCAFGLEDKFSPPSLLQAFIHESNEAGTKMRREGEGSLRSLKEATEEQVAALKSAKKCVEEHKIEIEELTTAKIDGKITKLENDISKLDRKLNERNLKRKADELGYSEKKKEETVSTHPTPTGSLPKKPTHTGSLPKKLPHAVIPSQEKRSSDGLSPNSRFDARFLNLLDGYPRALTTPATALSDGRHAEKFSGNVMGMLSGISSGFAAGAGTGISGGSGIGLSSGSGIMGPFTGAPPVGMGQLRTSGAAAYGWHGEGALNNSVGQNLLGPSPSPGQSIIGRPSQLVEQSSVGPPTSFPGIGNRSFGSSLYQFADTVTEGESHYSSSHMGNDVRVSAQPYPYPYSYPSSYLH